jgi:hypothetical protein
LLNPQITFSRNSRSFPHLPLVMDYFNAGLGNAFYACRCNTGFLFQS